MSVTDFIRDNDEPLLYSAGFTVEVLKQQVYNSK